MYRFLFAITRTKKRLFFDRKGRTRRGLEAMAGTAGWMEKTIEARLHRERLNLPIYQITQLPIFLVRLLSLLAAQDALVDGLAPFEAFFHSVPELDLLFPVLPAQQHNLVVHRTREIQQANVEVFYLHANGVNLRQRVLDVLKGLVALGAPPRHGRNVDEKPAA